MWCTMSAFYTRRRRSQSFGSYGSYKEQEQEQSSERDTGDSSEPSDVCVKPELIEGYAHMCFEQQALWFRGIMLTTDGTSYNLSGRRSRLGQLQDAHSQNLQSPDVIRDFPLRSQGSIDMKTSRAGSQVSVN